MYTQENNTKGKQRDASLLLQRKFEIITIVGDTTAHIIQLICLNFLFL